MTHHAKVTDGTIVIPAELLRDLGIEDGDSLVIEPDSHGGLTLKTYAQVVREVQAEVRAMLPPGYTGSVVDELIAERRAEAVRENAAFEAWQRTSAAE